MEFTGPKLEFQLKAQTPMIHFQARQTGATLRATEVKPKLDKFLLGKLGAEAKDERYQNIFLPASDGSAPTALKYKLRIFCTEPPLMVHINDGSMDRNNKYEFFYGNQNRSRDDLILGIESNPTVSVLCFIPALRELIAGYIEEFFLAFNFGTMQGKGFGGFLPVSAESSARIAAARALHARSGGRVYAMTFREGTSPLYMLNAAAHFYKLMKSGYNNSRSSEYEKSFIYTYMARPENGGYRSEKAFMKERGISPDYHPHHERDNVPSSGEFRYLRAVLGTTENISYLTGEKRQNPRTGQMQDVRTNIKIASDGHQVKRVPSPIFFKVVQNHVLITALPVPEAVFGKAYRFRGNGTGSLITPDVFNADDFLSRYVQHYNAVLKNTQMMRSGQRTNPNLAALPVFLSRAVRVEEVQL